MLTRMRRAVRIGVARIAVFLRIIVLRHGTNLATGIVAGWSADRHGFGLGCGLLCANVGRWRRVLGRCRHLFLGCAGTGIARITDSP